MWLMNHDTTDINLLYAAEFYEFFKIRLDFLNLILNMMLKSD